MKEKWFHIIYKLIELNILRNLRKICIQKDLLIFGIKFYILTDQLRCYFLYILYLTTHGHALLNYLIVKPIKSCVCMEKLIIFYYQFGLLS